MTSYHDVTSYSLWQTVLTSYEEEVDDWEQLCEHGFVNHKQIVLADVEEQRQRVCGSQDTRVITFNIFC